MQGEKRGDTVQGHSQGPGEYPWKRQTERREEGDFHKGEKLGCVSTRRVASLMSKTDMEPVGLFQHRGQRQ